MKVCVIGDVHGRDLWKAFPLNEFDKIIWLGDYCDSFDKSNVQILHNLKDIIQYKKDNMDKVVLLLGNHDVSYIVPSQRGICSGFRPEAYYDLNDLFKENKDLFQAAYQIISFDKSYLFTHAGVTSVWWNKFSKDFDKGDPSPISDIINCEFNHNNKDLFDVGRSRGGWYKSGGPFWADKSESTAWLLSSLHQIVGHTPVKEIYTHEWKEGKASITYCDTTYDYYELEI